MPASCSVAVLSEKLGLEELAQELVDVHPLPGRRVATLVHAMVAGASFIDDADVLRSGPTAEVLGHRVMAPSTLGTFLRRFSFGHVRQLDKLAEALLTRAWSPTVRYGPLARACSHVVSTGSTLCSPERCPSSASASTPAAAAAPYLCRCPTSSAGSGVVGIGLL
jgi:hypothetical protein